MSLLRSPRSEQVPYFGLFVLQDEHMDKKKTYFDTSSFQYEIVKDIPQQMNGSDCGMFTCKVSEGLKI